MAEQYAFYAIKRGDVWTVDVTPDELTSEGALAMDFSLFDPKLSVLTELQFQGSPARARVYVFEVGDADGYVQAGTIKYYSGVALKRSSGMK